MYTHAPTNYDCPFCLLISGKDNPGNYVKVSDIVYHDDLVTAFVGGKWWPHNPAPVIIIPNQHYENLYELPEDVGQRIFSFSQKVALALKETYQCEGVSVRQHNEPAGGQDVWHYHFQVMPRYLDDDLYHNDDKFSWVIAAERSGYVDKLKAYFNK